MERIWFLSPAIATAMFFLGQLYFSTAASPRAPVASAGADSPRASNVTLRVVEQIRSTDVGGPHITRVPDTEAQLLELFSQDGALVFFQDEVEVVETEEKHFRLEEVGVIVPGNTVP